MCEATQKGVGSEKRQVCPGSPLSSQLGSPKPPGAVTLRAELTVLASPVSSQQEHLLLAHVVPVSTRVVKPTWCALRGLVIVLWTQMPKAPLNSGFLFRVF